MKKKTITPEKQEKSITYHLKGFNVRNFYLIEPGFDITSNFNILNLKVGFNLDFSHNIDLNDFQVTIRILYHYFLNEKDINLLELVLTTEYHISNIKIVLEIDGDKFRLPDDLLVNFVSIAYSTARGILFSKTQGSYLNQFILPLIDPKEFIAQNLKFIEESEHKVK